ncbi:MAG TPA: S8 family serine peptidase [Thermomicrobiales bacterium]|nr:S8 family serine peptidase [Thermomicrobiales bacterium]
MGHGRTTRIPIVIVILVLLAGLAGPGGGALAAPPPGPPPAPPPPRGAAAPGQLIVGFRPGASPAERDAAVRRHGGRTLRQLAGIDARLVQLPPGRAIASDARAYAAEGAVRYAEPNFAVRAAVVPTDPLFPQQWGLDNTGQPVFFEPGTPGADIAATRAWDLTTGNRNIVVGVVDSGIDLTHPDLVANLWTAPAGWSLNGCGPGTHGFSAVRDEQTGVVAHDCAPQDTFNHGTRVAGIIGALGDNGQGVAGVNWQVQLMGLKFLDPTGAGFTAQAVEVIDYAVQARRAGVNIVALNNSWNTFDFSQALRDEIALADQAGILFVAAAGNGDANGVAENLDLTPVYPGSYDVPNVIAVTATDNRDAHASFANYGARTVQLGAPGVGIYSTITVAGGGYSYGTGTSFSAPFVTGAAALVLAAAWPAPLDVASLKARLVSCGDPDPSLVGITVSGRRLDVYQALTGANCGPEAPQGPVVAGWGFWASQGGVLTDAPAAAGFNGRVYVFARGTDNALYVKSSADGATFTAWRSLGGVLTAAPATASLGGRLYTFARGADNALYVRSSLDGTTWTDWASLGGVLTAAPAAASANGALYVLARGTDDALYLRSSPDGAAWTPWRSLGGVLTAPPAAAGFRGALYAFARGTDSALYVTSSADGATFTPWRSLGGVLTAAPAAATTGDGGALAVFAAGTGDNLYTMRSADGATYEPWVNLAGHVVDTPAAAAVPNGPLCAFVRWADDALWARCSP